MEKRARRAWRGLGERETMIETGAVSRYRGQTELCPGQCQSLQSSSLWVTDTWEPASFSGQENLEENLV